MSAKNVGSTKLSMNVATVPVGGVAKAHIHVGFDLMLYIMQGKVRHEYGEGLKKVVENQAGDFIYIEPGVPHEVFNISKTEDVVAVVARSDADEWANIIPYDRSKGQEGLLRGHRAASEPRPTASRRSTAQPRKPRIRPLDPIRIRTARGWPRRRFLQTDTA